MMISTQFVETSVTTTDYSPSQDYTHQNQTAFVPLQSYGTFLYALTIL